MKELGKKLREARIAKKIDFKTIYERTRVTISTIQSIEQGDIGGLPMTYYRAFVRTIAKEVGLDGNELLRELDLRSKKQAEVKTGGVYKKRLSLNSAFKKHQRAVVAGSIGACFAVLIVLYVIFGRDLFYEPRVSDIPQTSLATDTLKTGPFTLKALALENSWIEIRIDSGVSEKIFMKKGDEIKRDISRISYVGMDDPSCILLHVNEVQLVEAVQDSIHGLNLWIEAGGIVKQETRMANIGTAKTEESKKPVFLIGHIDEDALYQKEPVFRTNRDRYRPETGILDQIRDAHPSLSLVCFLGTWDPVSQEVIPKLLKVIHEINLPGVTFSIIGVDQQLKDKAGLVEFYQVQGIPTLIFLSRGRELGRIVGQPGERIESLFLTIVQKGESI